MPQRAFSLDDAALYALLACTDAETRRLLGALEQIGAEDAVTHGVATTDDSGETLIVRAVGPFIILFHPRTANTRAHIVDIRKG
jgi:hypothetical protein